MKLALGTVQLGLPYGINNTSGVPVNDEIKKIFTVANKAGIHVIDTAIAYGDAEEKIGRHSGGNFKIISKLPAFPGEKYSSSWLDDTINASLQRLQTSKLHGLLLHRPSQLLGKDGSRLFEDLQNLKLDGKVDNIGISIYEPSELDSIGNIYELDIVQAPLSILDRRLVESRWLSKLSEAGIEVHARSVFLQGLLLVESSKRLQKFAPWNDILSKYDRWLENSGLTALQACIRFVLSFKEISNIVVGIDNAKHLEEIIAASKGDSPIIPDDISSNDIKLINPLSWLDF
jgi:aryl-alcohol dehydrogenase-like predicted oxidoreductase